MDAPVLLKQFRTDPGVAFLEVIRAAPTALNAQKIKDPVKAAGAKSSDVDARWDKLRPYINVHPHIRKPQKTLYEWSLEPIPSATAVRQLSSFALKSVPTWLVNAYVSTIEDSLAHAETRGPAAQSTWNEQRGLEKAQVLAELAAEIECQIRAGWQPDRVLDWISGETAMKRLRISARAGERLVFDPEFHDATGRVPMRGSEVEVIRSGYLWLGAGESMVVVRPLVKAV